MRNYLIFGILITYLGTQFHEGLHWISASILGVNNSVAVIGVIVPESTLPWKFILIASAGPISTIILLIIGIALLNRTDFLVRQIGFLIVFINAVGRVVYDITSSSAGATDESGIANRLGISDLIIRIPITLLCVLILIYLLKHYRIFWDTRRILSLFVVLITTMLCCVLLNSFMEKQQLFGYMLFQPLLSGYTPLLALINVTLLLIFILLFTINYEKMKVRMN